ncbi:MAG TPA: putative nucleotide-diphospho-sugar transferase [Stellaceae bacterium]|nr:putative nucleotide-diphospho-sugar transferase [Stellaceae bacterium]
MESTAPRVYYCAIGPRYARMAEISAASLRRHSPGVPITLFTDQPVAAGLFDESIAALPADNGDFSIKLEKLRVFQRIAPGRGLFLDCDTYIAGDIRPLFSLMERYDIAVAYDFGRHESRPFGTHMNSGVIVFANNRRTRRLWRLWRERFVEDPYLGDVIRDQPAFEAALPASGARLFVLAPEFNLRLEPFGERIAGPVRILHGPHGVIEDGRVAALAEFLNSESGVRSYDWDTGEMRILERVATVGNAHLTRVRVRRFAGAKARDSAALSAMIGQADEGEGHARPVGSDRGRRRLADAQPAGAAQRAVAGDDRRARRGAAAAGD